MSGDLEDFLRRAAERRKAKAEASGQQAQPQRTQQRKPQYSDSRTERMARQFDDEEIVIAEIVEDPREESSWDRRHREIEEAKQAAAQAQKEVAKQKKKLKAQPSAVKDGNVPEVTDNSADALLRLLRSSGGVRQAVIIREILDRPEHRW